MHITFFLFLLLFGDPSFQVSNPAATGLELRLEDRLFQNIQLDYFGSSIIAITPSSFYFYKTPDISKITDVILTQVIRQDNNLSEYEKIKIASIKYSYSRNYIFDVSMLLKELTILCKINITFFQWPIKWCYILDSQANTSKYDNIKLLSTYYSLLIKEKKTSTVLFEFTKTDLAKIKYLYISNSSISTEIKNLLLSFITNYDNNSKEINNDSLRNLLKSASNFLHDKSHYKTLLYSISSFSQAFSVSNNAILGMFIKIETNYNDIFAQDPKILLEQISSFFHIEGIIVPTVFSFLFSKFTSNKLENSQTKLFVDFTKN